MFSEDIVKFLYFFPQLGLAHASPTKVHNLPSRRCFGLGARALENIWVSFAASPMLLPWSSFYSSPPLPVLPNPKKLHWNFGGVILS